mgnify:CR=1 FL=1
MKALILNSGKGTRMGVLTSTHPKCMTEISPKETILSRQLNLLKNAGIKDIVITTGYFDSVLTEYVDGLSLDLNVEYVKNDEFDTTNYIYSIYCAKDKLYNEDLILMHGDLVFSANVLNDVINSNTSCMTVSSLLELPKKDFKAVTNKETGRISKVGIDFFDSAYAAQPLYKLYKNDVNIWLDEITEFVKAKNTGVYAENAFNEVSDKAEIYALDFKDDLCSEIDNAEDLNTVSAKLKEIENRTVYMCFSTDILHSGHMTLLRKAKGYGKLIIGVLTDDVVASYKRFPLLPASERKTLFENIAGVYKVVEQDTLSYKKNLLEFKPDFVIHGDDWVSGFQKPIRDEVLETLNSYGGKLVEFPYARDGKYKELENRSRQELAMPDMRRARLKKVLNMKGLVSAMEAHSGLTGLLVENTVVYENGGARQFDAMWISSLCDSTAKGKPDIELVDMTSRFRTIDDICEVTTKPIIFDGDTGGLTEHFVYTVRTLERMGVSMIIIEDKTGLKKNSLFGTEVSQTQDSIENFCNKIKAGKKAQKTSDFMICARIESLILEKGMDDALERAFAFSKAGADAIMIHSRKKDPSEIFEFIEKFRQEDKITPIVLVPTSFNEVTEEEFKKRGANIIIYANQFTRTAFPAMRDAAETILKNHRAKECDDKCMPFKEIITLIPDEI